jgi:dsRNA-specific ribonuclease
MNAIVALQELVQSSKEFPLPSNCPALQFTYDIRTAASKRALEHRSIAAFFLRGIPHHVAGGWYASKKKAQHDSAERALRLLLAKEKKAQSVSAEQSLQPAMDFTLDDEAILERFCAKQPGCKPLEWCTRRATDSEHGEEQYVSVVEVSLFGVPHKLAGAPQNTEAEARIDAAQRALWYLQCPRFENFFEVEPLISGAVPHVSDWLNDESNHEAMLNASRQTAVMRTQNRLQQMFAHGGKSVWQWSYETDFKVQPPRFHATVQIPCLGQSFSSDWMSGRRVGERGAQLNAIAKVNDVLDQVNALQSNLAQSARLAGLEVDLIFRHARASSEQL